MRMPRVRFTIRRIMVASVIVIAVVIGARIEIPRRREQFRSLVRHYTIHELLTSGDNRLANYYGRLRAKYEYASRHPWLPVKPDSLESE
jgi:hypothetical protein